MSTATAAFTHTHTHPEPGLSSYCPYTMMHRGHLVIVFIILRIHCWERSNLTPYAKTTFNGFTGERVVVTVMESAVPGDGGGGEGVVSVFDPRWIFSQILSPLNHLFQAWVCVTDCFSQR